MNVQNDLLYAYLKNNVKMTNKHFSHFISISKYDCLLVGGRYGVDHEGPVLTGLGYVVMANHCAR